jgi:hypothetical protein
MTMLARFTKLKKLAMMLEATRMSKEIALHAVTLLVKTYFHQKVS